MTVDHVIAVPGGTLAATEDGSGPAVLLLHAGVVDQRAWEPSVPHLVAAGLRVIRYDRRGYGRSRTEDVPFSNRDDARAVLDALGVDRACLVGNSAGGHIAVDVAVETPERVSALVTVGASIGGHEPEPKPEEAAAFEEQERVEEAGDIEAVLDLHERLWVNGLGQPSDRVAAPVRESIRAMDRENSDRARVYGRPIPLEPRAATRLDRLTMPVLAVYGELDVSDLRLTAEHLAATCPDARAVGVPAVGHLVGLEAPDVLARLIVDHLRQARILG
jgi:pimeloyl-ACP methyl ester carboxylesterase